MIKVYHQQRRGESRMFDPMFDGDTLPWPHAYKRVATVLTEDLEHAWKMTNHIDHDWTENARVVAFPGQRSSMVGDVFAIFHETSASWEHYMVASCGFTKINPDTGKILDD